MTGFWTPIVSATSGFFRAWGKALVDSAPVWVRPHLAFARSPLRIDTSAPVDLHTRTDLIGHDLDICLMPELVLEHHFRIPEEAMQETKRVVALEAARVMPVSAQKLITGYAVTRDTTTKGGAVCLVATQRTLIQSMLDEAANSRVQIRSISAPSSKGPIRFPIPELARKRQFRAGALMLATLSALLIAGTAPSFYLDKLNGHVAETDRAIHLARAKTTKIASLQRQVKSLQSLATAVQSAKDQSRIVDLLAILTKASPDDVVIDELNLNGTRLRLSGRANSPEDWVIKLQKEAAFTNVRLTSVLGQNKGDKRRFEIHLTVLWPAERKKA